ncbi:MAG: 4'-phosphopantetheinyl transferase superfamily protein [Ruminococcus sp.]|nr:4'-phosphopantetheinyl transferase superfamily protein [Ruminococcus sp.]
MKLYACFFSDSTPAVQHENAHRLLAFVLYREYGIGAYTLGKNRHGKPCLTSHPHIRINLSHCKGMAVCGVGETALGVDGECLRTVRSGVVRRVCAPSEAEELQEASHPDLQFTRLWTLKESFVKAVGVGISYPMRKAVFSFAGDALQTNITGAHFWQYVIADRYVISACAAEPEETCTLHMLTPSLMDVRE